jgi:cell division protein FtsA
MGSKLVERTIVAIDVGTTKVCTLVAQIGDGDALTVTGVGIAPSRGDRKGVIADVEAVCEAIGESANRAERVSGHMIAEAYVGVGGGHIASQNNHGVVAIGRGDRPIDREDVERVIEAAQAIVLTHNRKIVHAIPREFTVDHQDSIRNPLGLMGYRLDVEAHIVTAADTSLQNLVRCIQARGIQVADLLVQPLASAEAVLTEDEKSLGVALVDMGGGTTDLSVFVDGSPWETVVFPVGGNHVTHDVAVGLRTPWSTAEDAKIRYAQVAPPLTTGEIIEIATFGGNSLHSISRQELCAIATSRIDEIVDMIGRELRRSGFDNLLPAGVVITGGAARLRGLREFTERKLDLPARIGAPHDLHGLVEAISSPAYAASVGLLLWGMRQERHAVESSAGGLSEQSLFQKIRGLLRLLLPHAE